MLENPLANADVPQGAGIVERLGAKDERYGEKETEENGGENQASSIWGWFGPRFVASFAHYCLIPDGAGYPYVIESPNRLRTALHRQSTMTN